MNAYKTDESGISCIWSANYGEIEMGNRKSREDCLEIEAAKFHIKKAQEISAMMKKPTPRPIVVKLRAVKGNKIPVAGDKTV